MVRKGGAPVTTRAWRPGSLLSFHSSSTPPRQPLSHTHLGRGQVHALLQHASVELGELGSVRGLRLLKGAHRALAEEDTEHAWRAKGQSNTGCVGEEGRCSRAQGKQAWAEGVREARPVQQAGWARRA